jgi:hypothetical protein
MNTTMLLAVDTARHEPGRHVTAAVETVRDLAAKTGDKVIVLHVHEFAVGRFGRIQVDCPVGEGERLVSDIVAELRAAEYRLRARSRKPTTGTSLAASWPPGGSLGRHRSNWHA